MNTGLKAHKISIATGNDMLIAQASGDENHIAALKLTIIDGSDDQASIRLHKQDAAILRMIIDEYIKGSLDWTKILDD